MKFKILTIFPQMIENALSESIIGRARKAGAIEAEAVDIRVFSQNKHKNTDDTPFGGGAGMVMTPQPLRDAMVSACGENFNGTRIYLSPRGTTFTQAKAEELSRLENVILVCGHYEGVDQRFIDKYIDEEISVGDYVLTGGELGALIITDAVARLVPGVLGCDESSVDESFSSGMLEYPQYTRPREFEGMSVPEVLLNGDQKLIDRWRRDEALKITLARRPEMLKSVPLDKFDRALLRKNASARHIGLYMPEADEEFVSRLNEASDAFFTLTDFKNAECAVYISGNAPEEVFAEGRRIYVNAPVTAADNVMCVPPSLFSPVISELTGDEGIKEVRFSRIDRYEYASIASALLPVRRALRYRADYGKSRSSCLVSGGKDRTLHAEFFDGSVKEAYIPRFPSAFFAALADFLSGNSACNNAQNKTALDLYRLMSGHSEDK